jgi:uncharacterized protein (DUF58 family)
LGLAGGIFVAVAVVFGRSDALLAGAALFGAVFLSWLPARLAKPPAVFVRTMTSGTLVPGSQVKVRLTPVPGAGLVPPPSCVADRTPWVEAVVSPSQDGTALGYTFQAPGRGAYQVGPARITLPGPLGLVRATYWTAPPAELLVAPALVEVSVRLPDAESDLPQVRTQAGAERVTEPAAVRDYQSGDPRRLVHWKATARRDRLMVREVVLRGLPQAWVLVDDLSGPGEATERALSIAASVAVRLLRTGHTVRLLHCRSGQGPDLRFDPSGGRTPLLEAFARVELTAGVDGAKRDGRDVHARPDGTVPGLSAELNAPAPRSQFSLSQRLLTAIGTRGAVAPIYGAFVQINEQILNDLGRLAATARPGQLWLTSNDERAARTAASLRLQGWTVAEGE